MENENFVPEENNHENRKVGISMLEALYARTERRLKEDVRGLYKHSEAYGKQVDDFLGTMKARIASLKGQNQETLEESELSRWAGEAQLIHPIDE